MPLHLNFQWRTAALLACAATLLGACDDPPPGLETPERQEALERCDTKLAPLASNKDQLASLCDCTTARLANQGLTLSDLDTQKRERAMEQVRWCMKQTGALPIQEPKFDAEEEAEDTAD